MAKTSRARGRATKVYQPQPTAAALAVKEGRFTPDQLMDLYIAASKPPSKRRPARERLASVWAKVKGNLRAQIKTAVISAGIGFLVGWVFNVILMGFRYGGYSTPPGSPTTGQGSFLIGSLFWFLAPAFVAAVIGYRIKVGKQKFRQTVREFPKNVESLVKENKSRGVGQFLIALGGALLITMVLGPSMTALLSVILLVAVAGRLSDLAMEGISMAWEWVTSKLSRPSQDQVAPGVAAMVALGGFAASLVAYFIVTRNQRVLAALLAVGVGIVLSRRPTSPATSLLLFLAYVLAAVFLGAEAAFADDGGVSECPDSWPAGCPGSTSLFVRGAAGGAAAAAGAVVGEAVGEGLGEEEGGDEGGGGEEEEDFEGT